MTEATFAVVQDTDSGKILAIKRHDFAMWVLPGGKVDHGESIADSVIREVFEETGVKVEVKHRVCEFSKRNWLTDTTYLYACTPIQGELCLSDETTDVGYFTKEELKRMMPPILCEWVDLALSGETFETPKYIEAGSLWRLAVYVLAHPLIILR
ncbi:MAG: NUDIX hydrolase, partial [Chlamydiia bacterium]|nr:NUDIX hydrolase [Chlamydiia bacterium]